ncbi:hypothetical protein HMPREF9374_3117 [Desmospora sp. 8437]|nr:hypothetical protein HMPREF9374_3117 [Desmospora sp. 8437]
MSDKSIAGGRACVTDSDLLQKAQRISAGHTGLSFSLHRN